MKTVLLYLKLALKGILSALIATAATAPLAPFMVLMVLLVGDYNEFLELANPFCILLGMAIATVVGLFSSLGLLLPLSLFFQKWILGDHRKKVLTGLLLLGTSLTLTAYFSGVMDTSYPNSDAYEFGLLVAALGCQVIGILVYFALFRLYGSKLIQPTSPQSRTVTHRPISARIAGTNQYCRIGQWEYASPNRREINFSLPSTPKNSGN